ncbi:hypothetical protein Q5O89_12355 [Peribacillus frigoritolerans]|nr:hypothetical protein [Peribacillus frigoritolerans]
MQTAYVKRRLTVLSSYNGEEESIPEGYSVEYGGIFCRLIIKNKGDAMHRVNLMKDAITRELEVIQLIVKGIFQKKNYLSEIHGRHFIPHGIDQSNKGYHGLFKRPYRIKGISFFRHRELLKAIDQGKS